MPFCSGQGDTLGKQVWNWSTSRMLQQLLAASKHLQVNNWCCCCQCPQQRHSRGTQGYTGTAAVSRSNRRITSTDGKHRRAECGKHHKIWLKNNKPCIIHAISLYICPISVWTMWLGIIFTPQNLCLIHDKGLTAQFPLIPCFPFCSQGNVL